MNTAVPQFHEIRIRLADILPLFTQHIGHTDVFDVAETTKYMLADYFYGEPVVPFGRDVFVIGDRALVFQFGKKDVLPNTELHGAIDVIGDIFWDVVDRLNTALAVSPAYNHRPSDCFYKFFPLTYELVIYTPVLAGVSYNPQLIAMDGRAVMVACMETLPSWLKVG